MVGKTTRLPQDPAGTEPVITKAVTLWRDVNRALEEKEPWPWLRLSLSRGQLRVLFLLATAPSMSPGAVAAALGVPKANVTGIIDRLVRQRLVSRQIDPQDRRSYVLRLTEKGKGEVDKLRAWNVARLERALEGMSDEELQQLIGALEVMLVTVKKIEEVPPDA